jgi:hypothetical protein
MGVSIKVGRKRGRKEGYQRSIGFNQRRNIEISIPNEQQITTKTLDPRKMK